ncbi:hypothetical protein ACOMHN_031995 [Nucella lapillus]
MAALPEPPSPARESATRPDSRCLSVRPVFLGPDGHSLGVESRGACCCLFVVIVVRQESLFVVSVMAATMSAGRLPQKTNYFTATRPLCPPVSVHEKLVAEGVVRQEEGDPQDDEVDGWGGQEKADKGLSQCAHNATKDTRQFF